MGRRHFSAAAEPARSSLLHGASSYNRQDRDGAGAPTSIGECSRRARNGRLLDDVFWRGTSSSGVSARRNNRAAQRMAAGQRSAFRPALHHRINSCDTPFVVLHLPATVSARGQVLRLRRAPGPACVSLRSRRDLAFGQKASPGSTHRAAPSRPALPVESGATRFFGAALLDLCPTCGAALRRIEPLFIFFAGLYDTTARFRRAHSSWLCCCTTIATY